ncbi:type II toxin-antitoxin system RelE/ParE family toxin [Niveispirillum sp. SYP-B3756]|uniref:type II toxin-antitoxin system RelE/ParE family toxin n=1 Tax=Niveispirillum sp. SYP-B3756 TaxID=2662178 RepID=UPI0012913208|nr:type II toxin-antitoxin system RelE/ParE family toxin [Niveispirillum sp. SYP-B3756]MQP67675.1 type II toxin-antitoxin system RelE/ParE family toxin [Niveispirillum sp. SYP-B3756]
MVSWSDQAISDLYHHVAYIDQFNPIAGDEMAARLLAAGNSLATFPRRGRARPDGLRELTVVPPYVLVYELTGDAVRILRIWHGAQER